MRFLSSCIATLCTFAGVALAQASFNISIYYSVGSQVKMAPIWYGDGNVYVGRTVPSSVKTAFKFTAPNDRADLLLRITPITSPPSYEPVPTLPDPTFVVVNNAPGAKDPLQFVHSAAGLSDDYLLFWGVYQGIVFSLLPDGATASHYYLDSTDAEGTYILKWKTGGGAQNIIGDVDSQGLAAGMAVQLVTFNRV